MATVKIIKSSAGFGFMCGAKYPMIIENVAIEDGMAKVTSRQLFEAGVKTAESWALRYPNKAWSFFLNGEAEII